MLFVIYLLYIICIFLAENGNTNLDLNLNFDIASDLLQSHYLFISFLFDFARQEWTGQIWMKHLFLNVIPIYSVFML